MALFICTCRHVQYAVGLELDAEKFRPPELGVFRAAVCPEMTLSRDVLLVVFSVKNISNSNTECLRIKQNNNKVIHVGVVSYMYTARFQQK